MRALANLFAALAALVLSAAPAAAHDQAGPPPPPAAPSATVAFQGGQWFDGERFAPDQWYAVDGRLTRQRPARVDVTVDLTGRWVLPPFVEAHNHDLQNSRFAAWSVDKYLAQGVFYSVQLCSKPETVADFVGMFGRPGTVDVRYAGACISSSDGHPLGIALRSAKDAGMEVTPEQMRSEWDVVDTLADLDRVWPAIAARKPSFVKLIVINSERYAANRADPELFGYNGLDPALVAPIAERAHAAGVPVFMHADSAHDFAVGVRAGVDVLVHLPGYRIAKGMTAADYRIPDEVIAEAARRGTVVVTTTVVAGHYAKRSPEQAAAIRATQQDNLRRLRAAGVKLAIGSDEVMGTVVDEVLHLDGLGVMPRAELLRRAVRDTAELMFPGRRIGRFEEGYEASLVAYGANPLTDLETLRRPVVRIKQGGLLAGAAPPPPAG